MIDFQRCTRCVMDNKSDKSIMFDSNGYCNYCTDALKRMNEVYFPNSEGERRLKTLIERLKEENKDKKYDCIMGISGGLDSSYLAYLGAEKWGLRILAIHVDDGYDTEISKQNIKKLCNAANIELVNVTPDAKQFNELTRAFILAKVPNLAIPQDNVLFANVYKFIKEQGIRTFLSGGNFALESILQQGDTHNNLDVRNIKDINRNFGRDTLDKLDFLTLFKRDLESIILKVESPRPLNYVDYSREKALNELHDFCGFEYYGSKHLENTLTKFIQVYWLYHKFNVDKRTSHLSSMIVSNQMSRQEALELLEMPIYNEEDMQKDIDLILSRVDISRKEFDKIMREPVNQHSNFKTSNYIKLRSKLRGRKRK